jgi:hypothetical protein
MAEKPETKKRFSATDAEFADAQRNFDFLLPYRKPLYTVPDTVKAIGREQDYVRELIDLGRLEAHQDSAFGTRKSNLVTRRSIAVYLARTAQYDPAHFVDSFKELLATLTPAQLTQLIVLATQERARR